MRHPGARSPFLLGLICATLLVWLAVAGCNNTCVSITSNPSTGILAVGISDAKPNCTLTTVKGTVRLQIGIASMLGLTTSPSSARHIFVSVRSIEAHLSTVADDDSHDWQELAPQLARQPVQVDLMARFDPCAAGPLGESVVPAGVYSQMRLRLVANRPDTGEAVPEVNACGSVGLNCIVRADGRIQRIAFDGGSPTLRIATEQIDAGSLLVLPDAGNAITIEFHTNLSLALPVGEAVRLVSVFTAARRAACQSP